MLDSQLDSDRESDGLQREKLQSEREDFRSLLKTNSRESSEITIEAAMMINT